ncbi:MAG: PspC domain-containing protein [Microgenomates group bacterium]
MAVKKNLYRSDKNKILAGIFGGLGEYFDVDPTLLRLGWILISVFTGFIPGLIAYFIAIIIVPPKTR